MRGELLHADRVFDVLVEVLDCFAETRILEGDGLGRFAGHDAERRDHFFGGFELAAAHELVE